MESAVWKSVNIGQQMCFMKYVQEKDSHKVYFTDLINVWMEELTSLILSKRCKELNSLVEAEPETLARHVRTLIIAGEEGTTITSTDDGVLRLLNIESELAGIPFHFTFKMKHCNAEMVYQEVTLPLLLLGAQQQVQIAELCKMLFAKDAEIEQYKLEGSFLKKRKLETVPFHDGILQQMTTGKLHSDDTTDPARLFAKLCSYLTPAPNVTESSARCIEKRLSPEPEKQKPPEPGEKPFIEFGAAVPVQHEPAEERESKPKSMQKRKKLAKFHI